MEIRLIMIDTVITNIQKTKKFFWGNDYILIAGIATLAVLLMAAVLLINPSPAWRS